MKSKMRLLAATLIAAAAPLAMAQSAANAGQTQVATKIASNFTTLAGSPDNALALVNALRNGTDVSLTSTVLPPEGSTEPPATTTTTFTPPTGKMGWGEVKHALALAQDSLARAGIANPTAEQLQTALVGGDITVTNADGTATTTTLRGVLTMRSEGMGWGNIAKAGGTKLGPVTSKVRMGHQPVAPSTPTTVGGDAAPLTAKSRGIATAAGTVSVASSGSSRGITTATGASSGAPGLVTAGGAGASGSPKGNAFGRGIVTAAGGGGVNVAANGHGKPTGVGVVTAGGGSAAAVTNASGHSSHAGGNGKGNGRGGGNGGG